MRLPLTACALFVLFAIGSASAMPDNIYMTVPNGSTRYITILLPDDAGWHGRGDVEYTITMTPGPERTWSDFSIQTLKRDENSTAQLPIGFSRKIGNNASCSEPFTLVINTSVGVSRVIHGGVCESSYGTVSTAPAPSVQPSQTVASAINQNFGLFDIAFSSQNYFAQVGGIANVTVLMGSYQDNVSAHVTLSSGTQSVSPPSYDINFGPTGSQRQITFSVQAPSEVGTYDLTVIGSVPGCTASACTITRHASLVVGSSPSETGFRLSIFPESINTVQGRPVTYRLTVHNSEFARNINISIERLYGLDTNFHSQELQLAADTESVIEFNVTPTISTPTSYDILLFANSGNLNKVATAYLNVNAMDAGAQRALAAVQATGNTSASQQAAQAYNQWVANRSLNSYGSLQDELNRLAQQSAAPPTHNTTNTTPPVTQPYTPPATTQGGLDLFGKDMWILIVIAAIGLAASLFISRRKPGKRGKGLNQEFQYQEGKLV